MSFEPEKALPQDDCAIAEPSNYEYSIMIVIKSSYLREFLSDPRWWQWVMAKNERGLNISSAVTLILDGSAFGCIRLDRSWHLT